MPKYGFEHNGKRYAVTANSPAEAEPLIDDVLKHLSQAAPKEGLPSMQESGGFESGPANLGTPESHARGKAFTETVAPGLGSAMYIKRGLTGEGPLTPSGAGLAAMDIASLGLASKLKSGALGARAGMAGFEQAAKSSAGAGLGSYVAGEAGAPLPVRIGAGMLGGGFAGGRPSQVRNVPEGQGGRALAATARGMGLPVVPPASSAPGAMREAFGPARRELGAVVGEAKKGLYKSTQAQTPAIIREVAGKGFESLQKSGVPVVDTGMAPELSKNPEAAQLVLDQLNRLKVLPADTPPAQAMEIANNLVEAIQGKVAASAKGPINLAGPIAGGAATAMSGAIEGLASPQAVKAMQTADKAFAKMATLDEMAFKASKTLAGSEPGFNPRKFVSMWANLDPAKKARTFTPEEVKAVDFLVSQEDPNALMRLGQNAMRKWTSLKKDLGQSELKHHPTTKLKEMAPAGRMVVGAAQLPAVGREELVRIQQDQADKKMRNLENSFRRR